MAGAIIVLVIIIGLFFAFIFPYIKAGYKSEESLGERLKFDLNPKPGALLGQPYDPSQKSIYNKKDIGEEKGSAFMTMMSLEHPSLLLSPRRKRLTGNYLKSLTGTSSSDNTPASPPESALDILNKRYASGEIGKKEYETIKADIER